MEKFSFIDFLVKQSDKLFYLKHLILEMIINCLVILNFFLNNIINYSKFRHKQPILVLPVAGFNGGQTDVDPIELVRRQTSADDVSRTRLVRTHRRRRSL